MLIYKIFRADEYLAFTRQGHSLGAPIDLADGYIHLSTGEQLDATLVKHFAGQTGLMIAEVDLHLLGDAIRWEPARGGELFPHIYAELPIHAVVSLQRRD